MSVHQESLEITKPIERMEDPPELEYSAVRNDSLAMFGAAIGGAILGMLLTLLILAIINGGTLSFTGGERLAVFEAQLQRVDENLNAVSYNVDVVAQQAAVIQDELAEVDSALQAELTSQNETIGELDQAVATLDVTRQRFDIFVTALADAMTAVQSSMSEVRSEVSAASEAAPATVPVVEESAAAPASGLSVMLYNDANGNGAFDAGEALAGGQEVSLINADGDVVATGIVGEDGALFEGLEEGDYAVAIDGNVVESAEVSIAADDSDTEGRVIYIMPGEGE